jgi:hypothetical protein
VAVAAIQALAAACVPALAALPASTAQQDAMRAALQTIGRLPRAYQAQAQAAAQAAAAAAGGKSASDGDVSQLMPVAESLVGLLASSGGGKNAHALGMGPMVLSCLGAVAEGSLALLRAVFDPKEGALAKAGVAWTVNAEVVQAAVAHAPRLPPADLPLLAAALAGVDARGEDAEGDGESDGGGGGGGLVAACLHAVEEDPAAGLQMVLALHRSSGGGGDSDDDDADAGGSGSRRVLQV